MGFYDHHTIRLMTKAAPCPYCNHSECGSYLITKSEDIPNEGDFSICFSCGGISFCDENLLLRKVSDDEVIELELTQEEGVKVLERLKYVQNIVHNMPKIMADFYSRSTMDGMDKFDDEDFDDDVDDD